MRPFFFLPLLCGLLAVLPGLRAADEAPELNPYDPFAGVHPPLAQALRRFVADAERWAYTQRFVQYKRDDTVESTWLARFDPSQHYDTQWTLLERDGKAPTESQQKSFQKRRAKRDKERKSLGEVMEFAKATIAFQSSQEIVYEVPLKLENDSRFPPDKFQAFVTVDRAAQRLQLIDVKLRENLRVFGVVSVKSGDARIEFAEVSPEHGPAISHISAGGVASVMFIPVGGRVEAVRRDYKRVTPYDERFQVKLGPLKAIDF